MTPIRGLFVVGTDTNVGKTRVAAGIARALVAEGRRVGVVKPVATGATPVEGGWRVDDAVALLAAIGLADPVMTRREACPIAFAEPLAPPVAARRSGTPLDFEPVVAAAVAAIETWRASGAEVIVVEGVGGLLCPIAEGATVADLAVRLDYPLVIVAPRGLGALNLVALTVEAATSRSLRVAGVVLNGALPTIDPIAEATNPAELARRLGSVPILAAIPHRFEADDSPLSLDILDWYDRSDPPRLLPHDDRNEAMTMPSSSDVILPPSPGLGGDPMPPIARPTPPPPPIVLDDRLGLAFRFGESESGESDGPSPDSGSSMFAIPASLVAPDPILGAIAESRPKAETAPAPQAALANTAPARIESSPGEAVEIEYVSGPNWPFVVLSSYASALTLALIWWVVLPRFRGRTEDVADGPAAIGATAPRRADRSRTVDSPRPIASDHLAPIGRPLRVGSLEVTAIEVDRVDVALNRATLDGKVERREGGKGALALRVRLRNTSETAAFAPLDEAFLRDRDDGLSDSFVELGAAGRAYLYPLPVASEWSIDGQDFPTLRPGETKVTRIVSSPDFPTDLPAVTWRLRLRTGLETTEAVGLRTPGG